MPGKEEDTLFKERHIHRRASQERHIHRRASQIFAERDTYTEERHKEGEPKQDARGREGDMHRGERERERQGKRPGEREREREGVIERERASGRERGSEQARSRLR